jgi:uncharacterized phage protein (TIGR01671 family)
MREIKFRVVYKEGKKRRISNDTYTLQELIFEFRDVEFQFSRDSSLPLHDCEANELIFMQYTGLKDKNGKEIYEDDIVAIENPLCQIQKARVIGSVFFYDASFGVKITRVEKWEKYDVESPIGNILWFLNLINNKEYEVIGNIYENPEMLNET